MEFNSQEKLQVGDWVKTKTENGELIHGYLERANPDFSKVALKVVASDNERIIGYTLRVSKENVKKMENATVYNEQQLETLIDLALITNDREWFMELSEQLNTVRPNGAGQHKKNLVNRNCEQSVE
ncbi:IDEAL domain-containing protein [Aquibacillus sediminis]|uniref:IDEAL domain-containing protein n=1 Tax=Aquibacillus sediminis TaxID=2574734 RepID=UPI0011083756|nr:IDEAL domain-containing protein [Aquibacillus sediminis]